MALQLQLDWWWCSFQQAAVSTSPPPAARPRPGQMIAIFLKMNKIPTDGSTFSRFIWDESRSWVAGGGQGWTLPGSGALLRHGHTIYRHTDARQPGPQRQTVGSDFMFIIISLTFIISKEIKVRNLKTFAKYRVSVHVSALSLSIVSFV